MTKKKKSEPEFDYVVARPWYPDDPNSTLCIYAFGGEVQRGTMKEAKEFLEYVKRQSENDERDQYGIYIVGMARIV